MFAKQVIKPIAVFGAAVTSAILMATAAQAADPERTASVMNQSNRVYEATLKFYLHPARLDVTDTPRPMMDHPAVIVARRSPAGFDWTSAFILHPARLAVVPEAPRQMLDHPAVTVARAKQAPSGYTAEFTLHPATVAKAGQLPYVFTSQFDSPALDSE